MVTVHGHVASPIRWATCTTHLYRRGAEAQIGHDLENVSELLARVADACCGSIWTTRPASDLQLLADELGLHQLSVEDALDEHQRDKYVHFERHVFLACHAVELDVERADAEDRWRSTCSSATAGW